MGSAGRLRLAEGVGSATICSTSTRRRTLREKESARLTERSVVQDMQRHALHDGRRGVQEQERCGWVRWGDQQRVRVQRVSPGVLPSRCMSVSRAVRHLTGARNAPQRRALRAPATAVIWSKASVSVWK